MSDGKKKYTLIETNEFLLNDILVELREIRIKLSGNTPKVVTSKPKEEKKQENKENKICKYCGKTHERPVDYAICARRNKK